MKTFLLLFFLFFVACQVTATPSSEEVDSLPADQQVEGYEFAGTFSYHQGGKGSHTVSNEEGEFYFLSTEDLESHAPDFATWDGQQVYVKGDILIHYCEPTEQCLMEGVLPSFVEIQEMTLINE